MQPLIFLDFDDVICVNAPYGGYDVFAPDKPHDLWQRLFHPPAVATLLRIMAEHEPAVVITTSWLRLLDKPGIVQVLQRTGLGVVACALHLNWEAPQAHGAERVDAINDWLRRYHQGEAFVVLDDDISGTGLRGSRLAKAARVVLCKENVGLQAEHLAAVRLALSQPIYRCAK